MIAEELMIGDWVHLPSIMSDEVFPIQVYEILNDGVKYICGGKKMQVRYEQIQPIPLTVEILEKNGFEKFPFHHIKNQHVWSFHQDMRIFVDLSTRKLNDNPVNGWSISISSTCTSEMIHKIDYVHELQHALKFSKIDKKIEL